MRDLKHDVSWSIHYEDTCRKQVCTFTWNILNVVTKQLSNAVLTVSPVCLLFCLSRVQRSATSQVVVARWVVFTLTWPLYLLRRLFRLGAWLQAAFVVLSSPVEGPTPGGDEAFVKQPDCWHLYCFYSQQTISSLQSRVEGLGAARR